MTGWKKNVFSLNITPNPPPHFTTFTYRRISSICLPAFISDISTSQLITNPPTILPALLFSFYDTLRSLLDKHAPAITKTTSRSRSNPWMTSDLLLLKTHCRKLERINIQSHSLKDIFKLPSATNKYHKLITSAKSSFNSNLILKSASNTRLLWQTINSLLHRSPTAALPTAPPKASLSQLLQHSSQKWFSKLHLKHLSAPSPMPPHFLPTTIPPSLESFSQTSVTEISTLIIEYTNSYCDLDPILISLLKLISSSISPTICNIVNLSLSTGTSHPH